MNGTCSVDACDGPVRARGWCNRHWLRWSRHGDPLGGGAAILHGPVEHRFWPKVDQNGPSPEHRAELGQCWVWTAATNNRGYPMFGVSGQMKLAHRVAYELTVGPIPDGLDLDHLCRRPVCVRPEHLEPVTNAENAARTIGLHYSERCHAAGHPMTPDNVRVTRTGLRVCRTCQPRGRDDIDAACPAGHERSLDNAYYDSAGYLRCRPCTLRSSRERQRRYRARKREAR